MLDVYISYPNFKKFLKNCQGPGKRGKTIRDRRRPWKHDKQRQGGNLDQILGKGKGPFTFIKEKLVKFEEFIVLLIIPSQC